MEEAQQERRELLKAMHLLQEEKQQLQEEQRRLAREREQERETCCLLRTHNQVRLNVTHQLSISQHDNRNMPPPSVGGDRNLSLTIICNEGAN